MHNKTQIVIVGQGIAGTLLSWFLYALDIPFLVINDDTQLGTSETVKAGIINPVTGRRYVETWNIGKILPFAYDTYKSIEIFLGINTITPLSIAQFFTTAQMQNAFTNRIAEWPTWLSNIDIADELTLHEHINFYNRVGNISPSYVVQMASIIETWRAYLIQKQKYVSKNILTTELEYLNDGSIQLDNINAAKIIFCGGVADAFQDIFCKLPFSINKGEFLIIETTQPLPNNYIYKQHSTIVPIGTNRYWVGSNYLWQFNNVLPTEPFLQQQQQWLSAFLKQPYRIVHHGAALRPATIERRPFVGFHPLYKNVGIFNGLGTKGCSLAPYYANQFALQIAKADAIDEAVDIKKFENILSK
jgi:hypothetical protein